MRKGVIGVGVLVLAAGAAGVLYSRSRSEKDKPYKLVEVTRGPVVEKALAVGAIRPKREIAVKSKISGIVKRSFREVGDRVNTGDPLFEILPDPTPMELTEARREVEIARNIFDQAKKRSDRTAALSKQGSCPARSPIPRTRRSRTRRSASTSPSSGWPSSRRAASAAPSSTWSPSSARPSAAPCWSSWSTRVTPSCR
jgi:multidrug efflux pump subunit AcrA (membrane-fusion protein)